VAALLSLRASGEASYGDPRTEQVKHISKFHANRAALFAPYLAWDLCFHVCILISTDAEHYTLGLSYCKTHRQPRKGFL
jgi:hypothetical protein